MSAVDPARPETSDVAGSAELWAGRWARHHDSLVRYVSWLLDGDVHAAEDVAQETAIRLWQHPEVLSSSRSLDGWLRTVARNLVVDGVRRRRVRPTEVALSAGVDREAPDELDHVIAAHVVSAVLAVLTARHREAVLAVYVTDRRVVDVAADMNVPAGTVKSRCHAAVRQLRASTPRPARWA